MLAVKNIYKGGKKGIVLVFIIISTDNWLRDKGVKVLHAVSESSPQLKINFGICNSSCKWQVYIYFVCVFVCVNCFNIFCLFVCFDQMIIRRFREQKNEKILGFDLDKEKIISSKMVTPFFCIIIISFIINFFRSATRSNHNHLPSFLLVLSFDPV